MASDQQREEQGGRQPAVTAPGAAFLDPPPPLRRHGANFDQAAVVVVCAACAVYLLRSLPGLLLPHGLLVSSITLLAGFSLGLASVAGAVGLAFYSLTHPAPRSPQTTQPARTALPAGHRSRSRPATGSAGGPTDLPPHALAIAGEYSGVVYTVGGSCWDRCSIVLNWPPTADASLGFKAWTAALSQGTLVLTPIEPPPGVPPPPRQQPPQQQQRKGTGGAASSAGAGGIGAAAQAPDAGGGLAALQGERGGAPNPEEAAPQQPAAKVGIPLEGCTVEVVTDGLAGRTEWARRAPLLVAHPCWRLLEGEQAVYLFADAPAAKEQWHHALSWWCAGGERLKAVQALYSAYCDAMRQCSTLPYLTEQEAEAQAGMGPASGDDSSATGGAGGEGSGGKRGWKKWGASKVQGLRRRASRRGASAAGEDGQESPPAGTGREWEPRSGHPSPDAKSANPAGALVLPGPAAAGPGSKQTVDSLDALMDAAWMKSVKRHQASPALTQAAAVAATSRRSSRPTSPRQAGEGSAQGPSSSAADVEELGSGSYDGSGDGFTTPLGSSPAPGSMLGASPPRVAEAMPGGVLRADSSRGAVSGRAVQGAAASSSPLKRLAAVSGAEGDGVVKPTPQGPSDLPEAAAQPAVGPSLSAEPPLPGMPPLLHPSYAVNAFVTRVAFDALRNPAFQEHVRSRIQLQLSRLALPEYIHSLEVVAVDLGSVAPTISNVAALPQPGDAIWPQVVFDLRYDGGFALVLECKLEIRDAAAWGALDKTLSRWEGRSGSGGSANPPHHAASAPALLGSSDGEEESGSGAWAEGSEAATRSAGGGHGAKGAQGGGFMGGIRQQAARKLRQLAESTATTISRTPLRIRLTFPRLEGTMAAWLPPPPGDRLFYAFLRPPRLVVHASPQVGGRVLKFSSQVARVSAWAETRMHAALTRTMVFPGGSDVQLHLLLPLSNPNVAVGLPGLAPHPINQSGEVAAGAAVTASPGSPATLTQQQQQPMQLSEQQQQQQQQVTQPPLQQQHQQPYATTAAAPPASAGQTPAGTPAGWPAMGGGLEAMVSAVPPTAALEARPLGQQQPEGGTAAGPSSADQQSLPRAALPLDSSKAEEQAEALTAAAAQPATAPAAPVLPSEAVPPLDGQFAAPSTAAAGALGASTESLEGGGEGAGLLQQEPSLQHLASPLPDSIALLGPAVPSIGQSAAAGSDAVPFLQIKVPGSRRIEPDWDFSTSRGPAPAGALPQYNSGGGPPQAASGSGRALHSTHSVAVALSRSLDYLRRQRQEGRGGGT